MSDASMQRPVICFERDGDVGVIIIDNPPVNAGSTAVRAGLIDAIAALNDDTSLRAGVLIGANNSFIAGSDIREFGKPLTEPQLPAVIAAIEASPKPVVAALAGAAERDSAKIPALKVVAPLAVNEAAVIGAGTMGAGIAACFAEAGISVWLVDRDLPTAQAGIERIAAIFTRQVAAGKLTETAAAARLALVRPAGDYAALANADLAVEAVFEDMAVKQTVFRALDTVLKPSALLASNTSYLDLDVFAACTSRPGKVLGLHFSSPANVMKLLEVVRAAQTCPQALATGLALAKRLRKVAVLAGNGFGFIGNRIYAAWRRQCELMLEEGALPQQIDVAMEAFGFALGPFAVADMSGLDIAWRMRQAQAANRDAAARYVEIPDLLCEQGRLGQKTGAGYYRYKPGARRGEVDPEVTALIAAHAKAKGRAPQPFTDAQIQARILITMVNEAALLLAEGVAEKPSDVDLVLVNGYGFPNWEGGPVFWANRQDRNVLAAAQGHLATVTGHGFRRGDLSLLLLAES